MMKSLYSGVSGLKNHTVRMDVIGNNIANVNTTSYKANSVTFRDVFYQTRTFASAGTNVSGGVNPRQVGYGLAMGSIDKVMTQSGFTFTGSEFDCAIQGDGFFQVMDAAGNIYYTRNGNFNVDNAGNLVDSNGYIVLGVMGDPTGRGPSSQRIMLNVPDVMDERASATQTVEIDGWDYEIEFEFFAVGPNGNIAVNIVHSESPFATMTGNVLTVAMDLTKDYLEWGNYTAAGVWEDAPDTFVRPENFIPGHPDNGIYIARPDPDGFQEAVNAAIRAGGIDLGSPDPLAITFPSGVPTKPIDPNGTPPNNNPMADTGRTSATNAIAFGPSSTAGVQNSLIFTAPPGLDGNRITMNLEVSKSSSQNGVTARWSGDVLTVIVPQAANYQPAPASQDILEEQINRAITLAAREDPRRMVTVEITGDIHFDYTQPTDANPNPPTNATNLAVLIGSNTRAVGLSGGRDNFYRTMANQMSTVRLENGRFAGAQSVRDLESVFIDSGGVIFGEHAVHGTLILGRIDLAIFQNEGGLLEAGTSYYKASLASGAAEVKIAESDGAGEVVSGALEMANVDLSQEFSDMIITQRGFQANSRIITVSDTMLEELINLKR